VAVIRRDTKGPKRNFGLLRWGLVPYWAKNASIGLKTINAMPETAAEKPAFRDAQRRRRCLIPADSFNEWQKVGPKKKQPYNFGMIDDSVFAFAGLWERWRDPAGMSSKPALFLPSNRTRWWPMCMIECPRSWKRKITNYGWTLE